MFHLANGQNTKPQPASDTAPFGAVSNARDAKVQA